MSWRRRQVETIAAADLYARLDQLRADVAETEARHAAQVSRLQGELNAFRAALAELEGIRFDNVALRKLLDEVWEVVRNAPSLSSHRVVDLLVASSLVDTDSNPRMRPDD